MFFKHSQASKSDCVIALGGNQPHTLRLFEDALISMSKIPEISKMKTSRLYLTSPVSPQPQPHFLNACCRFKTTLLPLELFKKMESIEKKLGKTPKPKGAPRCIDLDLIHYGNLKLQTEKLTLPHPRWHQRLFVLAPLFDLRSQNVLDVTPHPWELLTSIFLTHALKGNDTILALQTSLPFQEIP